MRLSLTATFATLYFLLAASVAGAYATAIQEASPGPYILGDVVWIDVDFDTEGEADISLLSVSVLFDDSVLRYLGSSAFSPSYALYTGGKGATYLKPATTNLRLRVNTTNQILLDWQNNILPGSETAVGGFGMAQLPFQVIGVPGGGTAVFELCNDCPGNILQLGNNSVVTNNLGADVTVTIPEPSAAGLSLAALLALGGVRLRARKKR